MTRVDVLVHVNQDLHCHRQPQSHIHDFLIKCHELVQLLSHNHIGGFSLFQQMFWTVDIEFHCTLLVLYFNGSQHSLIFKLSLQGFDSWCFNSRIQLEHEN